MHLCPRCAPPPSKRMPALTRHHRVRQHHRLFGRPPRGRLGRPLTCSIPCAGSKGREIHTPEAAGAADRGAWAAHCLCHDAGARL